jgi:CHAT domain-containing protein
VLAFFVGDGASHAWLLGKDLLRHQVLPGRARLQQLIDASADHAADTSATRQTEQQLGALLLARILDGATGKKLLIVPDGPLNAVPFAALPAGAQPDVLLLDRYLIGYAPSLALAFAQTAQARPAATRVAVVSGRIAIGIELPNPNREKVYLRVLLAADDYNETTAKLPL